MRLWCDCRTARSSSQSLGRRSAPYRNLSVSSEGSYWNLVVPYALASGFFRPGSRVADGLIRYLLLHGSRMLGVPRADAHTIYGKRADGTNIPGSAGLGQIYGLSVARLLADNDRADQLVLSLYGVLAIGMTHDTYVSGEAVSVAPQGDAYYRKTYLPPNQGANSTFLETLRLILVHERRGADGIPRGLDLAFGTPRRWLASGKTIEVAGARTSFGRLSYTITRAGPTVRVEIAAPSPRPSLRLRCGYPRVSAWRACVYEGTCCRSTGPRGRSTSRGETARSSSSRESAARRTDRSGRRGADRCCSLRRARLVRLKPLTERRARLPAPAPRRE